MANRAVKVRLKDYLLTEEYLSPSHPLHPQFRQSLARLLEDPRAADDPRREPSEPPSGYVTSRMRPPGMLYYFNDGQFMVAYGLSRLIDEDIYEVSVYHVNPTQLLLAEATA